MSNIECNFEPKLVWSIRWSPSETKYKRKKKEASIQQKVYLRNVRGFKWIHKNPKPKSETKTLNKTFWHIIYS